MRKRGFTLIELLAVIVVLAVIALITVPLLLNVVDKAKLGAAEASALNYIDAVEKYIAISQLYKTKVKLESKTYQISRNTEVSLLDHIIPKVYAEDSEIYLNDIIQIKGEKPDKGWVTINNNKVEDYSFVENHFVVTKGETTVKGNEPKYNDVMYVEKSIGEHTKDLLDNNKLYGNYTYMGGTYLKGVQNNNYVWYNGFMWRIMGKNQDGTIRLISEENITTTFWASLNTVISPSYNTKLGYINDWLNNYFYSHLNGTKNIIDESTWCVNTTTSNTSARTDCAGGTTFNAKIGLITMDEYNLSGASSTNKTYYLVNNQYYWTLTPYNSEYVWYANYSGYISDFCAYAAYGVRPVINIKPIYKIKTGNGLATYPYMLEQTDDRITNKTLTEQATSGEYVKLSNKKYRIVSKETQGIKLILDGYYEQTAGTVTESAFGSNTTFSGSTIDILLNGNVLTWLNSDRIINASWNQGVSLIDGNPYTDSLTDSGSNLTRKVGLIRVGEMLAAQSSTLLTKDYTLTSNYLNVNSYITMTKSDSASYSWIMFAPGITNTESVTSKYAVRPVIYVSGDNIIQGGNGTPNSPYEI